MSVHGPLGATDTGALQVGGGAIASRSRPARSLRASAGALGLAGLLLTNLLVAITAANTDTLLPETVRPIPSWLAGPFGSTSLHLGSGVLIAVLALMFACYVVAVNGARRISPAVMLMCIAALNAIVLLAPPLLSTDVFSYQFYGRMGALYGANPYLAGPHALALDPLYPYIGAKWSYTPTVYGPLFTLLSYALAPLSIAASALVYKAIAACASLGIVALTWHIARLRGVDPVRAVALVGLNPLIVLYGVGGGHNDLLMLLPLMAGIYMLVGKRERAGAASVLTAAAIKVTAGLPLLFAIAGGGGRRARNRRRELLVAAGITGAVLSAGSFALFGTGPLQMFATLVQVQGNGDWHSIPGFIGTTLGLGTAAHIVGVMLALAFVGGLIVLLRRVREGRLDWLAASGWSAVLLLLTASSLLPWYVAWLMPLAALGGDRRLWRTSIVVSGLILGLQLIGYIPLGGGAGS